MSDAAIDRDEGRAGWIVDAVVALIAVAFGGIAAWYAFPSWDDGVLWFNVLDGGAGAIASSQPDRPVMGAVWGALAAHGLLWLGAALVYAASWIATAWIAWAMWRRFFPEHARFAVAAALLAVSPVLLQTQAIAINPVFTGHFGSVVVYAGQLFVWRRGPRSVAVAIGAGATIVLLSLMSEYASLATIVAASAGYGLAQLEGRSASARRTDRIVLGAMAACAVAGYVVYRALGNAELRPERQLVTLGWRHVAEVPVRLVFSLWTGVLGGLLRALGEANFSRATVAGLPVGIALAAMVVVRWRRRSRPSGKSAVDALPPAWRRALALAVPLAFGILVVTMMSSTIRANVASRFWQPMLPITACLTLFVLLAVFRARYHVLVAGLCVFTAGYLEGNAAAGARASARQMSSIGERLHKELAPSGITVAMFVGSPTNHALGDPQPRPYELIAHLTRGWSAADRRRFFAAAYEWPPVHEVAPGLGGVCAAIPRVDCETFRGWRMKGAVSKVVWISFDADGGVHVEPERRG